MCRGVRSNIPLLDEHGNLSPLAIEIKRLPGYSTNKIPDSKSCDTQIAFASHCKSKYNRNWHGKKRGIYPSRLDYTLDLNGKQFFIPIRLIDNYSEAISTAAKPVQTKHFRVKVVHKPTWTNYSHCELFIFDVSTGNEIRYESKGWRHAVLSSIRDKVQEIARTQISNATAK